MKRCAFGAGLLAALLVLGLLLGRCVRETLEPVSDSLSAAREAADSGAWREARAQVARAKESWDSRKRFLSALSDHRLLEEAEADFLQLEIYTQNRQWGDFSACCAVLQHRLETITDSHRGSWWNILAAKGAIEIVDN